MLNRLINNFSQYMIRRAARAHGFMDPIALIARLNSFAKPAEVSVPIEVMRIGMVLQARGVINSQAIQHNLDWIWPYWVVRQFDPRETSFIPRAFSLTHINLTHRNWTAVGLPHVMDLPIVDPRGLVTPLFDGWSLDAWIVQKDGEDLIPSATDRVSQHWDIEKNIAVVTQSSTDVHDLASRVEVRETKEGMAVCRIILSARSRNDAKLVVSLRPYNPEGVSFINEIERCEKSPGWKVNSGECVYLNRDPERYLFSDYSEGDVYQKVMEQHNQSSVKCDVGLATAAAVFPLSDGEQNELVISIPLGEKPESASYALKDDADQQWGGALQGHARLNISDKKFQFLYDAALRTLLLHSGDDVFPGPYTYKHFWFRDASFMVYALLCAGITGPCDKAIELFFKRQRMNGYFCSQDGEWDSNGQVLWALRKYCSMGGKQPDPRWKTKIRDAAEWIIKKRVSSQKNIPHSGLLPAGFSAEHFGPNDYYYWDNFWAVAGLEAGGVLMDKLKEERQAQRYRHQARDMMDAIEKSLEYAQQRLGETAMPSSPYRRLDSSVVGSLAAGYPLNQWEPDDPRLMESVKFLLNQCFIKNGLFHDMSHSGINPYLTLYVAQVLLRAGDARYMELIKAVADLASETGQWPEAVHPLTLGGCMGDGQHAWAAAEWVVMMRNCFIREEEKEHTLILCQGVAREWYADGIASFGPAPTLYGPVSVKVAVENEDVKVFWDAEWKTDELPRIKIVLPGFKAQTCACGQTEAVMTPA